MRSWVPTLLLPIAVSGCCAHDGVRSLVDHAAWTLSTDDPFNARRPAETPCDPLSIGEEDFGGERSFTVKSLGCAYVTVEQPCATGACEGENLHVRLWHYNLTNFNGVGTATAALAIDGVIVWQEMLTIPSNSGLLRPLLPLDGPLEPGAKIQLNISNHGMNSWNLLEVTAGAIPDEAT